MENIKIKFVDLGRQYEGLRDAITNKFDEVSRRGHHILSKEVEKFEENIAKYCQTKYAVGVGNGTDALFLSLKALNISSNDEVITVPNTFIGTVGAVIAAGANPVFVDVGDNFNIEPNLIEKKINNKTKAIIPVHLTGRICEMDLIMDIAERRKLYVIEDAAQAIGAVYKGKKSGSFGTVGCFSLHPLKNLHVHGDGGVITTNDGKIYETLLKLRNHGLKNREECEFFGYNSRLDSIHGAIANIKLRYIDDWNERHRRIAKIYTEELRAYVTVPVDKNYEFPVYQNYVIMTEERGELQKFLLNKGIETKVHYPVPLHLQRAASVLGYKKGDFPLAEEQSEKILSLPIYSELTDEEVFTVINEIKSFFS